jgi:hypothetical protein
MLVAVFAFVAARKSPGRSARSAQSSATPY